MSVGLEKAANAIGDLATLEVDAFKAAYLEAAAEGLRDAKLDTEFAEAMNFFLVKD